MVTANEDSLEVRLKRMKELRELALKEKEQNGDTVGKVHSLEKECLNSLYYQSREKLVGDIGRYEQYARAVRLGKSYKVGIFSEN